MFIGFLIVFTQSSIHVILFLMLIFLNLTFLALILKMEFIALIFIIIYIGAVCVLMLFHVKLIKTFILKKINVYDSHVFSFFFIMFIIIPVLQLKTFYNLNEISQINNVLSYNLHFLDINYIFWLELINYISELTLFGILLYNIYFIYTILSSIILLMALIISLVLVKNVTYKKF